MAPLTVVEDKDLDPYEHRVKLCRPHALTDLCNNDMSGRSRPISNHPEIIRRELPIGKLKESSPVLIYSVRILDAGLYPSIHVVQRTRGVLQHEREATT